MRIHMYLVFLCMLSVAANAQLASKKTSLRPAAIEAKAFSAMNRLRIDEYHGLRRAIADSEPIDIVTNVPTGELGFKQRLNVLSWDADWATSICKTGSQESLPINQKHFPVILVQLPGSLNDALQKISNSIRCNDLERLLFYPVGIVAPVLLTQSNEMLPPWISVEHLLVAAMTHLPKGDGWTDDPRRFIGRECQLKDRQPSAPELPQVLKDLSATVCVKRNEGGKLMVGEWREMWGSLYKARNGDRSERDIANVSYDLYWGRSNNIDNWAKIDSGIHKAPISIQFLNKRVPAPQLLKQMCNGANRIQNRDFDPYFNKAFFDNVCVLRPEIIINPEVQYDSDRKRVFIAPLSEYIERYQASDYNYLKLLPLAFPARDQLADPAKARRAFSDALGSGYLPWGYSVWLIMDQRAISHPGVKRWVDEIRNGPIRNGYRGNIAFYSDIALLR
jgi:hypothetical protein